MMKSFPVTDLSLSLAGIQARRRNRILNNDPTVTLTLQELSRLGITLQPIKPEPKTKTKRLPKPRFTDVQPNGRAVLRYRTRRRTVWTDPKLTDAKDKLKDLFDFAHRAHTTTQHMSATDRLLGRQLHEDLVALFKEDYEEIRRRIMEG